MSDCSDGEEVSVETLCGGNKKPINIFSDGCTYQNRNCIMANALLHFNIENGVEINQKFLEKGHTQMECDSVHSVLENAMSKREIYLPSQCVNITREVRKEHPYEAFMKQYAFSQDFSDPKKMIYDSIRPGKKKGDPTVMDIRWLQYLPSGILKYKLKFDDELKEMPRRPRTRPLSKICDFPHLTKKTEIPYDKWQDLQSLKVFLPEDCQYFYDQLPHKTESVRMMNWQNRKKTK